MDMGEFDEAAGEELGADLAAAGELDPVPPGVLAEAMSAFAWLTIDAELAALTYDSAEDAGALAGVRGATDAGPRALTFEGTEVVIEVAAEATGRRRRLQGQVVPPQPGHVEVRHREGTVSLTVGEADIGQFSAGDLPPGPLSLRWLPAAGGGPLVTDWVVV